MLRQDEIARKVGLEAGYRNMRRGKRATWTVEDFAVAAAARRIALRLLQQKKAG